MYFRFVVDTFVYQLILLFPFSDQGSILYNILVGLLDKSVVPVSFLVRDVSIV